MILLISRFRTVLGAPEELELQISGGFGSRKFFSEKYFLRVFSHVDISVPDLADLDFAKIIKFSPKNHKIRVGVAVSTPLIIIIDSHGIQLILHGTTE